jgi:hypothetical protein
MKKKGDMKKLSREGSIVFPPGKIFFNILPFIFFGFINLPSQTQLNNFGISDIINTHSGYTKFTFLDYNKDGIEDLFLFGNQGKSFVIHKGLKDSTFSGPIRKFFFFPIDDIKWLTKSANGEDYFIFVSRNKRLAGLVSFTRNYSLQLLHTIQFNSYPSSITITDFDNDGKNEALVYGNNFNGIVIITNDGYRLESEPLLQQNVFSDLLLFDFNQDEIDDLVAVDVLNNTITFLENSEISGFISGREIALDKSPYSLQSFDHNIDDFTDLIIAKEGGLEIFFGDSVYSYANSVDYTFSFTPDNFLLTDFNLDNKKDLVAINKLEDQVVLFSDYEAKSDPLNIEFDGIADIKLLDKDHLNSLVALSSEGEIQILSNKNMWPTTFSWSVGGKPNKLKFVEQKDSLFSYLLVNNTTDNSINIVQLDSSGNFINFENNPLLNYFSEFKNFQNLDQFIGYSKQNRLLEIISKDKIEQNSNNPIYLYTKYPIKQLMIDDENNIQLLEVDKNNLFHETIIQTEEKFSSDKIVFIDSSVVTSYMNASEQIYYWAHNDSTYSFNRLSNGENQRLINLVDNDSSFGAALILEDQSITKDILITIFSSDQNEVVYLVTDDKVQTYKSRTMLIDNNRLTEQSMKFYSSTFAKKTLFIHNVTQSKIDIFEFDDKKNLLTLSNTIEAVNMNDYFVNKFYDKTYLVYTNNDNNCITFKVLN